MGRKPLSIGVLGDSGFDIFTKYGTVETGVGLGWDSNAARDVYVPSGARFLEIMLRTLLPSEGVSVQGVGLKSDSGKEIGRKFQSYRRQLCFLRDFKSPDEQRHLRIERVIPIDLVTDATGEAVDDGAVTPWPSKGNTTSIEPNLLAMVDCGKFGRARFDKDSGVLNLIEKVAKKGARRKQPSIFIDGKCPHEVGVSLSGRESLDGKQTIWEKLRDVPPESVCIVVSASRLRRDGAGLSRRLSWEQTVEDLATELQLFGPLEYLSRFGHVVVRFGLAGAVYIQRDGNAQHAWLAFTPDAKDGIVRDPPDDGVIMSKNAVVIAALMQEQISAHLNRATKPSPSESWGGKAARNGLLGCNLLFGNGFPRGYFEGGTSGDVGQNFVQAYAEQARTAKLSSGPEPRKWIDYDHTDGASYVAAIGVTRVPEDVLKRPPGVIASRQRQWQILHETLEGNGQAPDGAAATDVARENLAMAIAKFGLTPVLNRVHHPRSVRAEGTSGPFRTAELVFRELSIPPCKLSNEDTADYRVSPGVRPILPEGDDDYRPMMQLDVHRAAASSYEIVAPTMRFEKLVTVDRAEIESFRSIRNLIKNYVDREASGTGLNKPISVAVFGPPGSGKSFAVKQIAKNINASFKDSKTKKIHPIEYNVSQFRTVDDLGEAFTRVASVNNEGKIPLVFFDEFDCTESKTKLAWLRYFLAPMQDGEFYGASQTITLGRAIMVFAGGIYPSFNEFVPPPPPPPGRDGVTGKELEEVTQRRREFVDQKGPDFVSRLRGHIDIKSLNANEDAVLPMIRRAVVLRSLIEQQDFTSDEGAPKAASVDDDVLYALLTIDRYNHGTRSIEAVLQMCTPIAGRIEKASLPSAAQLDMHVDADEFFVRMHRGRVRRHIAQPELDRVIEMVRSGNSGPSVGTQKPKESSAPLNKSGSAAQAKKKKRSKKAPTSQQIDDKMAPPSSSKKTNDVATGDQAQGDRD